MTESFGDGAALAKPSSRGSVGGGAMHAQESTDYESESPDSGLALEDLGTSIDDVDLTVLGAEGDPTLALSPTAFHDFFGSWCV